MKLPKIGRGRKAPSDDELERTLSEWLGIEVDADTETLPELEPDHDWRSFDEMMAIFECAPSEPVWTLLIAWSAAPIPGVRWHCESCGHHTGGPTWLNRQTHCGSPMKPEACVWLVDSFSEHARALSVAFLRTRS